MTILQQGSIKNDFNKCVPFKVPLVTEESEASINVAIRGGTTFLNKITKILITPPQNLLFIQSDRPIYKPGQTIKFRIVSLDSNFLPRNQVFKTVELQDPNWNRIGQWLNQSTRSGILDLFQSISPEATQGYYRITAWDEKDQQTSHQFEIREYVLPKYEMNIDFPSVITALDKSVTLKVCAKYTYGKPVLGSVEAAVCVPDWDYYYYRLFNENFDMCKKYSMKTDKTGCGSWVINVTEFGTKFIGNLEVYGIVEESGTGMTVSGTSTAMFADDYVSVNFKDTPDAYRPGMDFKGKVVVTKSQSGLMKNETVIIYIDYGNKSVKVTLKTDNSGTASFSFNTSDWSEKPGSLEKKVVSLRAFYLGEQTDSFRRYPSDSLYVSPFYSKSKSFLKLMEAPEKLSCNSDATVVANYIIQGDALTPGQTTLDFFYIVLSKGSMAQNGRLSVNVKTGKENKGELTFSLKKTAALSPFAQVVVYTVLHNGEAVADSMNFPIEQCLQNKVSLKFSSPSTLPGEKTSLNLKANPGSLCSVRAIDQSVLLLRPEAELNEEFVFRMLPVEKLSGYPYRIKEADPNPCPLPWEEGIQGFFGRSRRDFWYPYYSSGDDVYSIFRGVGIKIATNSEVKEPVYCKPMNNEMLLGESVENEGERFHATVTGKSFGGNTRNPAEKIRKFFPETWIWDLIPVGRSGSVDVVKTVPDTITKWAAGAFCTSPVGFGLAPNIDLTALKPFFVSLALPYSVIREETFNLTASVFNYLPKCIMVKVTLADSKQFRAKPCQGCTYTQCVCSEESKTFQWIVAPSAVGKVNITVRAEAVQTQQLCGNEVVTFPDKGRTDTVMQSVLVEAEGTTQSVTQNEFICLTDRSQETSISLTLPKVFVKDSAKSSVTVLGDLMGHALRNIGDLLALPNGWGEHNMLLFATNIYILQYLESSGQLTPEIKYGAQIFLESGYQRELTYKHTDGSYSAFGKVDPTGNTWLTAFVMKSFGGAKKYVFIDQTNIDEAKAWLGQQQKDNGCFNSVGMLYNNEMMGGISGEVTLSAYITAALLELGIPKSDAMLERSLVCLKEASQNNKNIYVAALLSYTFTLAGDEQMRQNLLTKLDTKAKKEGVSRYWTLATDGQMGFVDIEMSAYVLLALLSGPSLPGFGLNYSAGIVHWLSKQQNAYGGFSSTQDTIVTLQALAKYSAATYNPEGSITVTMTSPSGQKNQFTANRNNRLLYQEKQLEPPTGTYKLRTEGKGCVFVQFAMHYNIPPPPDSLAFIVKADKGVCNYTEPKAFFTLTTTVQYNGTREETNMVIINVKLPSGYKLEETSLQALKKDPTIKGVDLKMDRVIMYLDGLKKKQVKTISLQLLRDILVENLKPAVVKVYDYYKTSELAVIEYYSPCTYIVNVMI